MASSIESLAPKAYGILNKIIDIKPLLPIFEPISYDLKKAGIRTTLEEYAALTILTAAIVFVVSAFPLTLLFTLLFKGSVISGAIMALLGSLILSFVIFITYYVYPKNHIMDKRKKINAALPFIAHYIISIANSGATITQIFRIISQMQEHKTIANEAKRIVFEVDHLGYNIADALKMASDRTPSETFRDLLWGIRNTMTVGGDLITYLKQKAYIYLQEYKRYLIKYSQQLSILVEVYTTVLLVGSIFFIVMTIILGFLSNNILIPFVQLITVFILLPFASIMFILLFKTLNIED